MVSKQQGKKAREDESPLLAARVRHTSATGANKVALIQGTAVYFAAQETAVAGVQKLYGENGVHHISRSFHVIPTFGPMKINSL